MIEWNIKTDGKHLRWEQIFLNELNKTLIEK